MKMSFRRKNEETTGLKRKKTRGIGPFWVVCVSQTIPPPPLFDAGRSPETLAR